MNVKRRCKESYPKFSALAEMLVRNKRPTEPSHGLFFRSALYFCTVVLCARHTRGDICDPTLPLMSVPAVSAVDPEIKPSDVPAVPTAQPPICLQSVVSGGNVLVLGQKETTLMV